MRAPGSFAGSALAGYLSAGLPPATVLICLLAGLAGPRLAARDCNGNGTPDARDIEGGTSADCNANEVPDECDVGTGNFLFPERVDHAFPENFWALAGADLDGDALLDLAVLGSNVQGEIVVRTLLNRGGAGLEYADLVLTGEEGAHAVRAADMDGDGDADLVVDGRRRSRVWIWRNLGGAVFGPPANFATGAGVSILSPPLGGLTVLDLDGDADLDIAIPDNSTQQLFLLRNSGSAELEVAQVVYTGKGANPGAVRGADLDGDADVDLVSASFTTNSVTVLRSTGGGLQYEEPVQYPLAGFLSAIELLDLDGDADQDIVAAAREDRKVFLLLNDGPGGFRTAGEMVVPVQPALLAAADFDRDGRLDIAAAGGPVGCNVAGGSFCVLPGRDDGLLLPPVGFETPLPVLGLVAGDWNLDGAPELVTVGPAIVQMPGGVSIFLARSGQRSADCDANLVPDECEPPGSDVNGNGTLDRCDIASGASRDCNANGVPDEGEGDCNRNGAADDCDIASGASLDADADAIPDECEAVTSPCGLAPAPPGAPDCNANGIADDCDLFPPLDLGGGELVRLGAPPAAVAAADLNGDGAVDLAFSTRGGCCPTALGAVTVLLSAGGERWYAAGSHAAGSDPASVVSGDFDGDGDVDLAVASARLPCRLEAGIMLLRNRGKGSFSPAEPIAGVGAPRALVAADLDRDGDLDLAAGDEGAPGPAAAIFLNDGRGGFRAGARQALVEAPQALAAADLDRDGDADLLAVLHHTGSVAVIDNRGDGSFQEGASVVLTALPWRVDAGDADGDGDADLAVISIQEGAQQIFLCWNDGRAAFPEIQFLDSYLQGGEVGFADLDGDGDLDLARAGSLPLPGSGADPGFVALILNQGGRVFDGPVILGAGLGPAALAARDLEADGDVDLVVANGGSNSLSVLRQREGSFGSAPRTFDAAPAVSALAAADLDGDADIDLAASSAGGNMIAILGQEADGTFQAGTPLVTGNSPSSPVAADLDGDGDADLAVTVLFGIDLFLNQGGGAFAERVELPVGSNPVSLEAADLNGDGRLDLVTANFLSGSGVNDNVSVLLNAGGAVFAPARNYAVGVGATDLAIGDLDGDGDADLVVSNFLSEELSLLFNRGRGTFAPAVSIFLDSGVPPTTKVVAADHDADRDVDLFVGGSFQGLLLRNQGGGRAFQAIYLPSPFELRAFAVADLDRDGDLDLAARSFGNLTLFRQRSPAEFVPAADYVFGPDEDSFTQTGADGGGASGSPSNIITDLIASDLDGDGDADLAMALPGLGKVTVVYNHTRAASRDRDHNGIPDECESDPGRAFGRGDANLDGRLDLSDAVAILGFLFLHSEPLGCRKAADANDDGRLNLTDAIRILYYLFLSEAQPPEPFGGCGYDPTRDGLGCEASPRCP